MSDSLPGRTHGQTPAASPATPPAKHDSPAASISSGLPRARPRRRLRWAIALAVCAIGLPVDPTRARAAGQDDEERPEVHSDFRFGSFPYSPEAVGIFESEDARLLVGALDRGWSVDKFVRETGLDETDVLTLVDTLEQQNLVRVAGFDMRPGMLLVREAEARALLPAIDADAASFVGILEENWDEMRAFAASLEAGAGVPEGQLLYSVVVGGLLTGGVVEALLEDQTLVPVPPRRARRGEGYYAWMTEGDAPAPQVKRESARVGRYTVVSVGIAPEDNLRVQIEDLRDRGPIFESGDTQRWRVFASVFSRDHLFPYLRSRRAAWLDLDTELRSSRYTAFGEFAAWYYQMIVTRTTEALVESGRIAGPETTYQYALRTGR